MNRRFLIIIIATLAAAGGFRCSETDGSRAARGGMVHRRLTQEEIERRAMELQALQAETESLYHSLKAKELQLMRKQAELDSIKQVLEQKEIELVRREKAARRLRTTAVIFFIVGLALVVASLRKGMPKSSGPHPAKPASTEGTKE